MAGTQSEYGDDTGFAATVMEPPLKVPAAAVLEAAPDTFARTPIALPLLVTTVPPVMAALAEPVVLKA